MKYFLPAILCAVLFEVSGQAQLFNFTTLAGSAAQGSANGATNLAQFQNPGGVAMDSSGNIFVADTGNDIIRKITPNGTVSTFAGSPGIVGSVDGNSALFNAPQSVAVDSSGNVYVTDTGNFTIRKITSTGTVSTLAGLAGNAGSADGMGTNAAFYEPEGVTVDGSGNVFVADTWNHTIRRITPAGLVSTIAGSAGNFGGTNATGTNALFYEPQGVAVDSSDNVFVADTGNNVIREIAANGVVTTLAGSFGNFGYTNATSTNALFNSPRGISRDSSGNLYVADYLNNVIRKITSAGMVTTVAGSPGIMGSADGIGTNALFFGAQGVTVNPTNSNFIYVADTGNSTIRQLTASGPNWIVGTLAGDASIGSTNATGTAARFFWPMDMASDGHGNFYVADAANNVIRKIAANGTVTTFAGSPGVIGSTDGNSALFNAPQAVAVDKSGNVYVADTGNSTIRVITSGGTVSTLAGVPGLSGSFDGQGTNAQFYQPSGIAVDTLSNVYVADTLNHTIREVTPAGLVTTYAGTAGNFGDANGAGSAAQFNRPVGMAIDGSGNLYVTDFYNHTIREIAPGGIVTTLAGLPGVFGSIDGSNSTARFFEPEGIAVDGSGNVYVADSGNYAIRQLTPSGTNWVVSTIAGWPGNSGSADGSGIAARFSYPAGMAFNAGNLFVVDSANNTMRSGSIITDNPPTILGQPQNVTVDAGNPATFNVSATGGTLYYQWLFNGVNIPGATALGYTLPTAQTVNAGNYSVEVISPTGSVLSSNAVLTVLAPPIITNQPVSQACLQGSTVAFSVTAGPQPLTYQWLQNGRPLSNSVNVNGATTATLTLNNVTTANSASYSVLINNGYGYIMSSSATLTVFYVPPADSIQPVAWWQLNEGTGSTAFDYSGNGHNGTVNSGVSWTANGFSGNGAFFDGTNGGNITISSSFKLTANWTATMWVNRWGAKDSSVLLGGSTDALKLEQHAHTNHVGYTIYGKTDNPLGYATPQNTWTHLAFVETSAGVSLYVNGVLNSSFATTSGVDATTIGFGLPAATTDYLDATLDDVRVYNQALTAAQISNIYNYGRITPVPSVALTSPTNGANFIVSSNIALTASVVTNAQTISAVQFYAGSTLLGQNTTAPYTFTWTNAQMGSYSLTANVVYNGTSTAASAAVGIYVAPSTNQTSLAASEANGALQLSWPADHTGWRLLAQTNSSAVGITTNWSTVISSITTNQITIPVSPTNGSVFYRLVYP